jgi:predicted transposase/invertase (TIGR01784 family)
MISKQRKLKKNTYDDPTMPLEVFLNPFTDFGFKRLFGTEAHKDLLMDFLNSLLPAHHQIQTLTFRKNEHLGGAAFDRRAIFDLYCESQSGERFIVEIQRAKQLYFKDRSIFYSTFPIQEQAQQGEWNFKLQAVYTIALLDFCFDDGADPEEFLHMVRLRDDFSGRAFYDNLVFIFAELPKFKKTIDELETHQDKWFYAFKNLNKLSSRPEKLRERVFQRFFEIAAIAQFNPTDRDAYDDSVKVMRDLANCEDTARREARLKGHLEGRLEGLQEGRQEGLREGREEGREEGLQEGLSKGREEGRHELLRRLVTRLIAAGISTEDIAVSAGCSLEDVAELIVESESSNGETGSRATKEAHD